MAPCCAAARGLRAEVVCLALLRHAGSFGALALALMLPVAAARRLGSGLSLCLLLAVECLLPCGCPAPLCGGCVPGPAL